MTIETKMDPLAASFAAMEQPPHDAPESSAAEEAEETATPAEQVADHIAAMKRWMDAHTVVAARPAP